MGILGRLFRDGRRITATDHATDHGVRWDSDPGAQQPLALYQIAYSQATLPAPDSGFIALDNRANWRPDWREYHPIRHFLHNAALDDDRFYAFLSPKFTLKTGLGAAQVQAFAQAHPDADVLLFSPFLDLQALFANCFVQGEYMHPGLMAVAEAFFGDAGLDVELATLVTDYRRSVFCNFFAAKPPFWRAWFALTERLYRQAETPGPLRGLLTTPARYRDGEDIHMKIFVMERVADLLMAVQPQWKVQAYPTSLFSSMPYLSEDPDLVQRCNALKAAFRDTGDARHMAGFRSLLVERGMPPPWELVQSAFQQRQRGTR